MQPSTIADQATSAAQTAASDGAVTAAQAAGTVANASSSAPVAALAGAAVGAGALGVVLLQQVSDVMTLNDFDGCLPVFPLTQSSVQSNFSCYMLREATTCLPHGGAAHIRLLQ